MSSLDDLKARIASISKRDGPKPLASTKVSISSGPKPILASLLARAKSLATEAKEVTAWRKPEGKCYKLELPRTVNPHTFILQARADFPRINLKDIGPFTLQVEGLAEYRWLKSRL